MKKQALSTKAGSAKNIKQEELLVGIDLGTSYSSVGIFHMGRAEVIANDLGLRSTPSVVSVLSDGEALIGDAAVSQASQNRSNTVFGLKSLLGCTQDSEGVQNLITTLPFNCETNPSSNRGELAVKIGLGDPPKHQLVPIEDLVSHVLKSLRTVAESYVGLRITGCVLAYPPDFTEDQIQALGRSAKKAGLKVAGFLSEPCAVALAHRLDGPEGGSEEVGTGRDYPRNVLVLDWGGGGVTATVLSEQGGVLSQLGFCSDHTCGGPQFVDRLRQFCCQDFLRKHRMDVAENRKALGRLTRACEQTLSVLSLATQATVEVDSLMEGLDLRIPISRARFEDLVADLIPRGLACIRQVLAECTLMPEDIHLVLPSGGLVQIPRIQNMLQGLFTNSKIMDPPVKSEELVALGATWQAYYLSTQHPDTEIGEEFPTLPESIGVLDAEGNFIPGLLQGCFLPANSQLALQCAQQDDGKIAPFVIKVVESEELKTELAQIVFSDFSANPAQEAEARVSIDFSLSLSGQLEVCAAINGLLNEAKRVIVKP